MNRLWNLWCELSGTDPSDSRQKLAFNMDRRVATLSAHAAALVEGFATYVWSASPGISLDEFLDQWLVEVEADQRRRNEVAERRRAEQRVAEARRLKAEQEAQRRELEGAARRRNAENEARRWAEEVADERRRATERARREDVYRRAAVRRKQVGSLYNITSVENLASIASRGILCHDWAAGTRHDDLSDSGVQERRDGRLVGNTPLHRFANLYFNPRNAMLYRLHKYERRDVVVLEISTDILDLPGVVVLDGNAASGSSNWWVASEGLAHIDLDRIHARSWLDPDGARDLELMRVMQAEVLVPGSVAPRFIEGVRAPSEAALERATLLVGHWPGRVDRDMFFDW